MANLHIAMIVMCAVACGSEGKGPPKPTTLEFPPSPHRNGLSTNSFEVLLEVEGDVLSFSETSRETRSAQITDYGLADVTEVVASASGVTRTTRMWELAAIDDTFLIQHHYEFRDPTNVTRSSAFAISLESATEARLAYLPADNTVYQVEDYLDIPAIPGYAKPGHMLHGGTPLNYAWNQHGGIALAVLTDEPGTYELPLGVSDSGTIQMGEEFSPQEQLGQSNSYGPDRPLISELLFVSYNDGDYFAPLDRYTKLLEIFAEHSIQNVGTPNLGRAVYWKTWGLGPLESGDFTKASVLEVTSELMSLGIDWIMLDYGWFIAEGNWAANPDIFSDDADLTSFIAQLKASGFRVGLWFQPIQVDLSDEEAQERLLAHVVRDEDGDIVLDDDDLALLDPSKQAVLDYVRDETRRLFQFGADHIYLDSQTAQLAIPPNHDSDDPLASHHGLPAIYDLIREEANRVGAIVEICPDGRSQSILNMPQHITNIGDPKNDRQLRAEFKSLKAILGEHAIIGTYVDTYPDNPVSGSFLNLIGIGGMLQTLFSTPDSLGRANWQLYLEFYFEHDLVRGAYLDLYDIGFDYPEGHVVHQNNVLYYSFFTKTEGAEVCMQTLCEDEEQAMEAEPAMGTDYMGEIELRGLEPNRTYTITRFPDGDVVQDVADVGGRIQLSDIGFTKEVLFLVE